MVPTPISEVGNAWDWYLYRLLAGTGTTCRPVPGIVKLIDGSPDGYGLTRAFALNLRRLATTDGGSASDADAIMSQWKA
jgi:hypothetical protein